MCFLACCRLVCPPTCSSNVPVNACSRCDGQVWHRAVHELSCSGTTVLLSPLSLCWVPSLLVNSFLPLALGSKCTWFQPGGSLCGCSSQCLCCFEGVVLGLGGVDTAGVWPQRCRARGQCSPLGVPAARSSPWLALLLKSHQPCLFSWQLDCPCLMSCTSSLSKSF